MDEPKELATPMVFSVYPREREAIYRIMKDRNMKSTFDVVRLLAERAGTAVRKSDFNVPKYKS